jgi:hypothetical protein
MIAHCYLAHLYGDIRDEGYFDDPGSFTAKRVTYTKGGKAVVLTPDQQVNNPDSYAGFFEQYYL